MGKKHINTIDNFIKSIAEIKKQYQNANSVEELTKDLRILVKQYHHCIGIGDYLLNFGEEYISNEDYLAGIAFIKVANEHCSYICNTTVLNLRMAEYHIENNEVEIGIEYLHQLCSAISNYEESIELHELTAV